jgi:methylphosphotriester-DNA--protein-cysteine methyltransferase
VVPSSLKEAIMSTLGRLKKRLQEKAKSRLEEKLTLRLDSTTYRALDALAREHGMTLSELAREALTMMAEEYLAKGPKSKPGEPPKKTPKKLPTLFPDSAQE